MKTLFTLIIVLIGINSNAQLFPTIEPAHQRVGLLFNHSYTHLGFYSKAWYGSIKRETLTTSFHTQTVKIGTGVSYKFNDGNIIYLGINKSHYFNVKNISNFEFNKSVNLNKIHKISFDVGVSMKIDRLSLLMMSDLLNWESMIGFSYQLKK